MMEAILHILIRHKGKHPHKAELKIKNLQNPKFHVGKVKIKQGKICKSTQPRDFVVEFLPCGPDVQLHKKYEFSATKCG